MECFTTTFLLRGKALLPCFLVVLSRGATYSKPHSTYSLRRRQEISPPSGDEDLSNIRIWPTLSHELRVNCTIFIVMEKILIRTQDRHQFFSSFGRDPCFRHPAAAAAAAAAAAFDECRARQKIPRAAVEQKGKGLAKAGDVEKLPSLVPTQFGASPQAFFAGEDEKRQLPL